MIYIGYISARNPAEQVGYVNDMILINFCAETGSVCQSPNSTPLDWSNSENTFLSSLNFLRRFFYASNNSSKSRK